MGAQDDPVPGAPGPESAGYGQYDDCQPEQINHITLQMH